MTTTTAPASIFISYRRDDSAGHAGRLADRLAQRLGPDRVFRDIEDIAAGEDFVTRLERQVDECQVMLALIGPRWLAPGPGGRPRLFDEQDWVRREIVRAMSRGLRVIPVLLQGATLPGPDALPPDLAPLVRLNAMELREAQFERDADYLVSVLAPPSPRRWTRRVAVAVSMLALVVGGAIGAYRLWESTPGGAQQRLEDLGLAFDTATYVEQAAEGRETEVRLFLRAGQAVDATNFEGVTALQLATANGHVAVVRRLLDGGAQPDPALITAAHAANDEVFDLLLSRRPAVKALNEGLAAASAIGSIPRMERLLKAGAHVDGADRAALRNAAFNGQVPALRWLIDHGARLDGALGADGETILHVASGASMPNGTPGDPITDAVTLLLENGADPNAVRGPASGLLSTPLLIAAYYGRSERAKVLLTKGAHPDLRSSEGSASTPLMVAAERDHTTTVKLLLDHGAAIDAADTTGETALMMAARRGATEALELLILRGADLDAHDEQGVTALMLAVDNLDEKTVARLLEARADVDAATIRGSTALMRLASRNILPDSWPARRAAIVARLLIARGARTDRRNALGQDAHALAKEFEAPPEMLAVLDDR